MEISYDDLHKYTSVNNYISNILWLIQQKLIKNSNEHFQTYEKDETSNLMETCNKITKPHSHILHIHTHRE